MAHTAPLFPRGVLKAPSLYFGQGLLPKYSHRLYRHIKSSAALSVGEDGQAADEERETLEDIAEQHFQGASGAQQHTVGGTAPGRILRSGAQSHGQLAPHRGRRFCGLNAQKSQGNFLEAAGGGTAEGCSPAAARQKNLAGGEVF